MLNTILIVLRTISLIFGGHEQVALENLALREQLGIFQRSVRHPKIRQRDRLFWVCLQKVWKEWRSALVIVRPETVLDWQRKRFKRYWSQLSQHKNPGRPRRGSDIGKLVKTMAEANPSWGYCRRILAKHRRICTLVRPNASSLLIQGGSCMRRRACTDLCGGRSDPRRSQSAATVFIGT